MKTILSYIRNFLLKTSLPVQHFLQIFNLPERAGCALWVREIDRDLVVGDIFLSRENWHLTNLFIPGFYSHAAIYVGNGKLVEAVHGGVVEADMIDWVLGKDFIAQVRPLYVSGHDRERAAAMARKLIGNPYDFLFVYDPDEKKNKAFYCSEVPYFCFRGTAFYTSFTPRESLGQLTITPQDYRDAVAKGKLDIIGEYRP